MVAICERLIEEGVGDDSVRGDLAEGVRHDADLADLRLGVLAQAHFWPMDDDTWIARR